MVEDLLKYDLRERFKAILKIIDSDTSCQILKSSLITSPTLEKELRAIKELNTTLRGVTPYPSDDEFIELLLLEYKTETYNIF
jgi:hypothetical protein